MTTRSHRTATEWEDDFRDTLLEDPEMPLIITEPSYHGVAKVIVRPKFGYRTPGIENLLTVIVVDTAGKETTIATLFGPQNLPSTTPIEVEASNEYHVGFTVDDDVVIL